MEADYGGWYSLVGIEPSLSIANHTRATLSGLFFPTNPSDYLHPDPNYRGLIYVGQYSVNGASYTYAQTVVQVNNGSATTTLTQTQNGPASGGTYVSLTGWLDYGNSACVTLLGQGSSGTITGIEPWALALILIMAVVAFFFLRKRR